VQGFFEKKVAAASRGQIESGMIQKQNKQFSVLQNK
jgi:hypothetical protein